MCVHTVYTGCLGEVLDCRPFPEVRPSPCPVTPARLAGGGLTQVDGPGCACSQRVSAMPPRVCSTPGTLG